MQSRIKLEEERRALAAFVSKFDSLGFSKIKPPKPTSGGAAAAFAERKQNKALEDDSPEDGISSHQRPAELVGADAGRGVEHGRRS